MSEHEGERRRRQPTRVRTLGDAIPVLRGAYFDANEPATTPKSGDEMRADREAARDRQPMATSCGIDGCDFNVSGTAGECRDASKAHRAAAHPRQGKTYRKRGVHFKRRGEKVDPATVAESRRVRQLRDDQLRIDTINRGRTARGETLIDEGDEAA